MDWNKFFSLSSIRVKYLIHAYFSLQLIRLLAQTLNDAAPDVNQSPPDETEQFNRKDHPPPLGQRERSTSAPNVCYNLVGQSAEISDDLLHRITKGTYNTLHGKKIIE